MLLLQRNRAATNRRERLFDTSKRGRDELRSWSQCYHWGEWHRQIYSDEAYLCGPHII